METEFTAQTSLREIIKMHPEVRPLLAKYGLLECGGAAGPDEPLDWFARVHRVDPEVLMNELREAIAAGAVKEERAPAPAASPVANSADELYRRFLVTAIALTLTGGVIWGSINLTLIAYHHAFLPELIAGSQAHAHVQIFGWVALFIMGIAYHVLPRLKATALPHVELADASYWLMTGGVVLHALYRPFMAHPALAPLPILAGLLELCAILFFAIVAVETMRNSTSPADMSDKYLLAGTLGFVAMGVMNVALLTWMATHGTAILPPAWNWAYRHVQLTAFVTMFILGISLRTLPVFLGKPEPRRVLDDAAFWLIVTGFILHAIFDVRVNLGMSAPGLLALPATLELLGVLGFMWNLGVAKRAINPIDGANGARAYETFVYAAYAWFFLATIGIAVLTYYQALSGHDAPHALMGSYRHAQTVGFITFMILGYSMRVLPVFIGRPIYSLRLLNATFVFMMIGITLRVVFQALTVPFGAWSFPIAGISGWLEAVGLSLYGYNLLRTLYATEAQVAEDAAYEEDDSQPLITETLTVARLIAAYPKTLKALLEMGFTPLGNPLLRQSLGKRVTLKQAAAMHRIPVEEMLERLRQVV